MRSTAESARQAIAEGVEWQVARKYSVTIAGHSTSVRIESAYWRIVIAEAQRLALPVSSIVAEIDAARTSAEPAPNLASAIRLWALERVRPQNVAEVPET